jgi:hypothetical protein
MMTYEEFEAQVCLHCNLSKDDGTLRELYEKINMEIEILTLQRDEAKAKLKGWENTHRSITHGFSRGLARPHLGEREEV